MIYNLKAAMAFN